MVPLKGNSHSHRSLRITKNGHVRGMDTFHRWPPVSCNPVPSLLWPRKAPSIGPGSSEGFDPRHSTPPPAGKTTQIALFLWPPLSPTHIKLTMSLWHRGQPDGISMCRDSAMTGLNIPSTRQQVHPILPQRPSRKARRWERKTRVPPRAGAQVAPGQQVQVLPCDLSPSEPTIPRVPSAGWLCRPA